MSVDDWMLALHVDLPRARFFAASLLENGRREAPAWQ
jgi:hypothetical protein